MKIEFTPEEVEQLRLLVEGEFENGLRAIAENPEARLLIKEWNKVIITYKSLLEKLQ